MQVCLLIGNELKMSEVHPLLQRHRTWETWEEFKECFSHVVMKVKIVLFSVRRFFYGIISNMDPPDLEEMHVFYRIGFGEYLNGFK